MPIRISGLVKVHNEIRNRLQRGLPVAEHHRFRDQVRTIVLAVETICRNEGTTPNDLPGPSRRAYEALKNLDLRVIPEPQTDGLHAQRKIPHIQNVTAIVRDAGTDMWHHLSRYRGEGLRAGSLIKRFESTIDTVDEVCESYDCRPWELAAPTRHAYSWLRFLSEADNLALHLRALWLVQEALPRVGFTPGEWILSPMAMRSLFRMSPKGGRISVRCNEAFVTFGEEFWTPFVLRSRNPRQDGLGDLVGEFANKPQFIETLAALEGPVLPAEESAVGQHHDLNSAFDRVNRKYFDSAQTRPTIQWSLTPSARTFGRFQFSQNRILVASSLDHPDVPSFVVEFVVYHELLHRVHGIKKVNGRSHVHTSAFRGDEREFERFEEAEAFLSRWSRKLA